jgi:hypothetical protein
MHICIGIYPDVLAVVMTSPLSVVHTYRGVEFCPCNTLVQPRRSLDGNVPYPGAWPLNFRRSVAGEGTLPPGELASKL